MGAIEEFASDITALSADIENQFKSLNDMKLAVRQQSNDVAARWSDYFARQKADLQKAQDMLNRISNIPLSETSPKTPTGAALSTVPPKVTPNGG